MFARRLAFLNCTPVRFLPAAHLREPGDAAQRPGGLLRHGSEASGRGFGHSRAAQDIRPAGSGTVAPHRDGDPPGGDAAGHRVPGAAGPAAGRPEGEERGVRGGEDPGGGPDLSRRRAVPEGGDAGREPGGGGSKAGASRAGTQAERRHRGPGSGAEHSEGAAGLLPGSARGENAGGGRSQVRRASKQIAALR